MIEGSRMFFGRMLAVRRRSVTFALITAAAAAFVLGVPAAALAVAPTAFTIQGYSTGATTAGVDFGVDPGGETTTYVINYDTQASTWCTSGGFTGSAAHTTVAVQVNFTDSNFHDLTGTLTGLTAGSDYCAQVVVTNGTGSAGADQGVVDWTQGIPVAQTFQGSSTGATTASITGQVNPAGQDTQYFAEYDKTSSGWCMTLTGSPAHTTSGQDLGASDATYHNAEVDLTGLSAGTMYCAEIFATNASGTSVESGQVQWTQGLPGATTYDVNSTSGTNATVDGNVDPAGQATNITFQYDDSSSMWCTSFGFSGSPAHTTGTIGMLSASDPKQNVSDPVTGLTPGQAYCGQIVATNGSGAAQGGQVTWTQGLPSASTENVTSTGATTATVDGLVNPTGQTTTYQVQWDLNSSPWCMSFGASGTPAHTGSDNQQTLPQTDDVSHEVTTLLTGLTAGQSYCAQLTATNPSGTVSGGTFSFSQGAPIAFTFDVTSTGATTATLDGSVNPTGQTTTYEAQWGMANGVWCQNFGASGSPDGTTTPQPLAFTDNSSHNVSVDLTGLVAGTQYCGQLVAINGSGTAFGGTTNWTEGAPLAQTFSGTSTGATTAKVGGIVNPAGQDTMIAVQYNASSSPWCMNFGASGTFTTSPSQDLGNTGTTYVDAAVDLSGLVAGTSYCGQLIATNAAGTATGGFVTWTEGAPTASTIDVTQNGTAATVFGSVNPSGQTTTYQLQWDVESSQWCTNFGGVGSPANTTTATALGFTDDTDHQVQVDVTPGPLVAGTQYCAQLTATNAAGTSMGGFVQWTQGAPIAYTSDVVSTAATTANVLGNVNPNGIDTMYSADWDIGSSQWCQTFGLAGNAAHQTTPVDLGFTDATSHNVTVGLTTLTAGTNYCAAIVATNSAGTSTGFVVTWTQGTPLVVTSNVNPTASTTADVSGTVNPLGQTGTTYQVQWDLANSQWCGSFGFNGLPANTTTATALGASDSTAHNVTVHLTGLTANTDYCAQLIATNVATGTGLGGFVNWTQNAVPQHQLSVSLTGTGSGTVSSSPPGINNCGTSLCTANFDEGTMVTLTAAANAGSAFMGWSGGGCSGTGQCQVTLSADTSVTATFTTTHTLTIQPAGGGSGTVTSSPAGIDCGATCVAPFADGTQVTITAVAAAGSVFTGFEGGGCPASGNQCQITISADTVVTADFSTSHALLVTKTGAGSGTVTSSPAGINCGATCSAPFPNEMIQLTAAAAPGSVFTGWTGACTGTTDPCVIPAFTADATATANFDLLPPPASCTLKASGSKVALKGSKAGLLTLTTTCDQTATVSIKGKVTITIGKKKSTVSLKTVGGEVTANTPDSVKVKIPASALSKLKKHAKESVTFTLTATNANGNSTKILTLPHLTGH